MNNKEKQRIDKETVKRLEKELKKTGAIKSWRWWVSAIVAGTILGFTIILLS